MQDQDNLTNIVNSMQEKLRVLKDGAGNKFCTEFKEKLQGLLGSWDKATAAKGGFGTGEINVGGLAKDGNMQ